MRAWSVSVDEDTTPQGILAAMDHAGVDDLPVVTDAGTFRGMVVRRAVERRLYDAGAADAPASTITEEPLARATADEPIERAVDRMLAADLEVVPVLSADGTLEGVLVREDLKEIPGLLEAAAEERRQREAAAEAGPGKVILGCALVAVALGLVLFAFWVQGPPNGLPRWVAWVDGFAAALAFTGAVAAFSREMISIPIWSIAGVGLCFSGAMGHAWYDGPAATWVQVAFGVVFLAMAATLGVRSPRRRRAALEPA